MIRTFDMNNILYKLSIRLKAFDLLLLMRTYKYVLPQFDGHTRPLPLPFHKHIDIRYKQTLSKEKEMHRVPVPSIFICSNKMKFSTSSLDSTFTDMIAVSYLYEFRVVLYFVGNYLLLFQMCQLLRLHGNRMWIVKRWNLLFNMRKHCSNDCCCLFWWSIHFV